jgi:GntR family transcriptional regulator/MocR family aminotransferase
VRTFVDHRESLDIFPPTLYQVALSDFIAEGHFARHLRRMRAVYLHRRDALVTGIQERLPDLSIANADAGMHLTAWLPSHIDDRAVVRIAAAHGVSATALSSCYAGTGARPGLVLGFGGADEAQIGRGVETLARVIRGVARATLKP